MKIAVQLRLLPGETTADKAKWARDNGVEGIEINSGTLDRMRREAEEINGLVRVCSVCGNCDVDGGPGFEFLDPDPAKRRRSIEGCKAVLGFCGEIGAVGQVVPPIFGGPRVPDLSPFMKPLEIEDALMVHILQELGPFAAERNTLLLLEPLNRYEQHYLRKQSDAVRVIEKAGAPGVAVIADLFHMHIEETDTPEAIFAAASHIKHVHLADNTRMEPGTGDIGFGGAFIALVASGFNGYMAYECSVTGDTPTEKAKNLANSLDFVREVIERAKDY